MISYRQTEELLEDGNFLGGGMVLLKGGDINLSAATVHPLGQITLLNYLGTSNVEQRYQSSVEISGEVLLPHTSRTRLRIAIL